VTLSVLLVGIVSFNFKINKKIAIELNKIFLEVVIANGFESEALKIFKKKKNLRVIDATNFVMSDVIKFNSVNDTLLSQSEDLKKIYY
jgi:phosphoribosylaminoimidazolecarboxamide formyltransferase/IMP cyclohydrolase